MVSFIFDFDLFSVENSTLTPGTSIFIRLRTRLDGCGIQKLQHICSTQSESTAAVFFDVASATNNFTLN